MSRNETSLSPAWSMDTLAIRAGSQRSDFREHSEALFLTSSFVYGSAEEAAACFAGQEQGYIYSRFSNPSVEMFENRLAALEGAERCVATASGMAAILATALALLKSGDEIVSSRSVFGTTHVLFNKYLHKFGVKTHWVDIADLAAWEAAMTPATRLLFLETPSNPLCEIADLQALAALAHRHGAKLVVDNCFCTPILQKPFDWGADIVIHSATKYLDGQGRVLGGAVLGGKQDLDEVYAYLRTCGASLSAFNAWIFLKGMETLGLRMRAHSEHALYLARWLEEQEIVAKVHYAGLPSHPQHALAARQQSAFGGIIGIELKGGQAAAWRCINATRLFSITGNLGDTRSTITHPATTTHGRLSAEEKQAAGISPGLLRLSIGLEDVTDLKSDLAIALKAAAV